MGHSVKNNTSPILFPLPGCFLFCCNKQKKTKHVSMIVSQWRAAKRECFILTLFDEITLRSSQHTGREEVKWAYRFDQHPLLNELEAWGKADVKITQSFLGTKEGDLILTTNMRALINVKSTSQEITNSFSQQGTSQLNFLLWEWVDSLFVPLSLEHNNNKTLSSFVLSHPFQAKRK